MKAIIFQLSKRVSNKIFWIEKKILFSLFLLVFFVTNNAFIYAEELLSNDYYIQPWNFGKGKGELNFESSAKKDITKKWFNEGLKLLHSFEYQQAAYAFNKVQKLEPAYSMGYWGEAMSNIHLLWYTGNYIQAQKLNQKLYARSKISDLNKIELALVNSLNILLNRNIQNNKNLINNNFYNIAKYNNHMKLLYNKFPNDSEIASFYALSILATRHGIYDNDKSLTADEVLQKAVKKHPRHPGILHYIIHSNENSINYTRAQSAAAKYSKVAPYALHAVHMPSHISSVSGNWYDSMITNKKAWSRSLKRQKDLKLNDDSLEYHSALYLNDAYLNLSRFEKSYRLIKIIESKQKSAIRDDHLVKLMSNYIVQTPDDNIKVSIQKAEVIKSLSKINNLNMHQEARKFFAQAYYNYKLKNKDEFNKFYNNYIRQIKNNRSLKYQHAYIKDDVKIMSYILDSIVLLHNNNLNKAIEILNKASNFEDNCYYESHSLKPPKEMLGDVFLENHMADQAAAVYQKALILTKNRRLALEGLLKASEKNKDFQFITFAKNALKAHCNDKNLNYI